MPKLSKADTKIIEDKFGKTAFRLAQERSDFLLPQVRDFVQTKKWINLRPEYQRRLVWGDEKRSLFIESLLLNIPIPPIFLYECELGRYEVMDGQQRLNSIVDFYEGHFSLTKLTEWKELNGLKYGELPERLQRGLDRRRLSATVLLAEGASGSEVQKNDIRKLVFERLNTGGQHLNAQELRHCLYVGPFDKLLIDLAGESRFTSIWQIPPHEKHIDVHGNASAQLRDHSMYSRMKDCELVLRFFAFRQPKSKIRGSVRSMLDRCMANHVNHNAGEVAELGVIFKTRLDLAHQIFDSHTFQYENDKGKWLLSMTLYDGVMVALDRLWDKRQRLILKRAAVAEVVADLIKKPSAFEVIIGRPNTARALIKRLDLLTKAIDKATK